MVEVIPLKDGVTFKRVFSDPEIFGYHKIVTTKLQFAHFGKIGYNALPEFPQIHHRWGLPLQDQANQPKVFQVEA